MIGAPARHDYLLRRFDDDSVLLVGTGDGSLYELNASAAVIWESYLAGATEAAIAERLAGTFDVPLASLQEDVRATLRASPAPVERHDPYAMRALEDGFEFSYAGTPILVTDAGARSLRLVAPDVDPALLRQWIGSLVPNLLVLRGQRCMHGAAVTVDETEALVLTGSSGAGKTTTARAFAAAGAELLAEDKLLLVEGAGARWIVRGAEARMFDVASMIAASFAGAHEVPLDDLDVIGVEGERLRVGRVWELAVARRADREGFALRVPTVAGQVSLWLRHQFRGESTRAEREHALADACATVTTTLVREAAAPDGLEALAQAAVRYRLKTTA